MIRWLLLIPFALLIAVGMSSLFFFIASMVDPLMATLTGETLFVGFWNLVDAVFSSDDPGPIVADAMLTVGRIMFTLLVLPPLVIAVISEVLKMRSLIWYALATGALTAAVPWILRGAARVQNPEELHVSAILGLTGAVAGFIYWAIAGRDAGGRSPSTSQMPSGS
ncbi:hypothetical protein DC522_10465 [Microvirga sp. KLBC 81]|uniref:hypothetical protein n=1 Tax=Microvirga sp. KLBC 81 TaxID=1862707 RepID=UPI000D50AAFD|nr:hypothetical protein [Microvirga sp. KLBC 81]PVE24500.1 hypothetical protein DC522_10465 [Microvirga sp. KLBC 81]